MRPEIAVDQITGGHQLAAPRESRGDAHMHVAALEVRQESFAAIAVPAYWPPHAPRRPHHQDELRIKETTRAEPAADIRRDDPKLGGGHAQRRRERAAMAVDALATGDERVGI